MLKICHRLNTIERLQQASTDLGVEMDLHAYGDRLVVHHDSFTDAISFEDWLDAYRHRFVILNVKEEGIENRVRDEVLKRGIQDFFMLDLSFPALIKMAKKGEKRVAVRVSKYEPVESALSLAGQINWVWLDMFTEEFPLTAEQYEAVKAAKQKICLVSPELHGRDKSEITSLHDHLKQNQFAIDAVCTKYPELW